MIRNKKATRFIAASIVVTSLAIGGFTWLSASASAGQGGALDDGKEFLHLAGITLEEANAAAQSATPGALNETDLEYYQGKLVFNIDVGDKDVKVDALTGLVLNASSTD